MELSAEQLDVICRIGRENSARGSGESLRDLLDASEYRRLRPGLHMELLVVYLRTRPELMTDWVLYSEDKRTDGGSYLVEWRGAWRVGRIGTTGGFPDARSYHCQEEACAHYILEELDFWAGLGGP